MEKVKYLIIGAGISGLTAASYLKDDYLVVEKDSTAGGYCRTIYKDDYVWDYAGHFFHFKTDEFKKKFIDSLDEGEIIKKDKKTYIYYKDRLVDYPFQMNIHELDKEEFIDCLYDLFHKQEKDDYDNFLDMLYGKFGTSITEKFLRPYNEKLYACDLSTLDKDAMGRFFPYADKEAIINNMKASEDTSYNNTFLYPKKGAQTIIDILMRDVDEERIYYDTVVERFDLNDKKAVFSDGTEIRFDYLINTIPFNQFLKLTSNYAYKSLGDSLSYNKVLVFNLGFNKKSKYNDHHWLYFPDKKINFYRAGFYDNILGTDKLSMYIEIGYSKDDKITDKTIQLQLQSTLDNLRDTGIIDDSFVLKAYSALLMDPAYVHIDTEHDKYVQKIKEELMEDGIYSIGRYGGWTYCSMEDCMIEARETVKKIGR